MRRIALLAALALSACAHPLTANQSIYAAYGSYSAALASAADYAETPGASPAVVARLNAANKATATARDYGRAYVECNGRNETVVVGIDCSVWDFNGATAADFAARLRTAAATLLKR